MGLLRSHTLCRMAFVALKLIVLSEIIRPIKVNSLKAWVWSSLILRSRRSPSMLKDSMEAINDSKNTKDKRLKRKDSNPLRNDRGYSNSSRLDWGQQKKNISFEEMLKNLLYRERNITPNTFSYWVFHSLIQ